jgi:hypothetical protein
MPGSSSTEDKARRQLRFIRLVEAHRRKRVSLWNTVQIHGNVVELQGVFDIDDLKAIVAALRSKAL